jgi:hypothetical protein
MNDTRVFGIGNAVTPITTPLSETGTDPIKKFDQEYCQTQTQLPGPWYDVKISCPKCRGEGRGNSDEFVYLYDDRKTCYCVQCDTEFDFTESLGSSWKYDSLEDQEIKNQIENVVDTISDDPKTVSEMADKILGVKTKVEKCDCGGLNGCHFVMCPKSPIITDKDGYTEKECSHGWHYIRNCPTCRNLALLKGDNSGGKLLPAYQHKSWDGYASYSGGGTFNSCTHLPQHIINGDGWGVWAGKKEDCRTKAKDYDIILNLTFTSIKEPHIIPIPEMEEFEEYNCQFKEIQLDWPDYGVVNLPLDFWVKLLKYLEENQLKMLVFCLGGHGRTGTALAIMMCLSLDYTPKQAIAWINRHYCSSAVETLGQEQYVDKIYKEYKKLIKEKVEVEASEVKPDAKSDIKSEVEIKSEALHQQAVEYINKIHAKDKLKPLAESAKAGKE